MSTFTCPKCGGHTWGTKNALDTPEDWIRYCTGFIQLTPSASRACHFEWPIADDEKYGLSDCA